MAASDANTSDFHKAVGLFLLTKFSLEKCFDRHLKVLLQNLQKSKWILMSLYYYEVLRILEARLSLWCLEKYLFQKHQGESHNQRKP